jgi:hypothetical protein
MTGSDVFPTILAGYAKSFALAGTIDDLSYLANSKVFLYSGSNDTVVNPTTMHYLQEFYEFFIDSSSILLGLLTAPSS